MGVRPERDYDDVGLSYSFYGRLPPPLVVLGARQRLVNNGKLAMFFASPMKAPRRTASFSNSKDKKTGRRFFALECFSCGCFGIPLLSIDN